MAASTPRKTTTARKTTRRAPRKPAAKADLGMVLDDDASKAATDQLLAVREPLFTVGGVTYTIPKEVPPSWTLQAYDIAFAQGDQAALAFAARKCLTEEAWQALTDCQSLTKEHMKTVLDAVLEKVLPGGVLVPKA